MERSVRYHDTSQHSTIFQWKISETDVANIHCNNDKMTAWRSQLWCLHVEFLCIIILLTSRGRYSTSKFRFYKNKTQLEELDYNVDWIGRILLIFMI